MTLNYNYIVITYRIVQKCKPLVYIGSHLYIRCYIYLFYFLTIETINTPNLGPVRGS